MSDPTRPSAPLKTPDEMLDLIETEKTKASMVNMGARTMALRTEKPDWLFLAVRGAGPAVAKRIEAAVELILDGPPAKKKPKKKGRATK